MGDPFNAALATRLREDNDRLRQQLDEANKTIEKLSLKVHEDRKTWVRKIATLRRSYRRLYSATKLYVDTVTAYYLVKSMGHDAGAHPDGSAVWQAVVAALYECTKQDPEEGKEG